MKTITYRILLGQAKEHSDFKVFRGDMLKYHNIDLTGQLNEEQRGIAGEVIKTYLRDKEEKAGKK